ncbi:MAG: hypothetical protein CM1200mP26_00600 [Acidimicrobiales bacterium]|nr:MAG: hypothetical protein CM1200mP26_00600 [Acidimicrobiales bacterium]
MTVNQRSPHPHVTTPVRGSRLLGAATIFGFGVLACWRSC